MNLLFVFLQAGGGGDYSFLIMMVAIFAIMYFFMIRPQNKKQKEIANFRKNLEVGQEVITAGGIYGKIIQLFWKLHQALRLKLIEILSSLMLHPTNNRQSK